MVHLATQVGVAPEVSQTLSAAQAGVQPAGAAGLRSPVAGSQVWPLPQASLVEHLVTQTLVVLVHTSEPPAWPPLQSEVVEQRQTLVADAVPPSVLVPASAPVPP